MCERKLYAYASSPRARAPVPFTAHGGWVLADGVDAAVEAVTRTRGQETSEDRVHFFGHLFSEAAVSPELEGYGDVTSTSPLPPPLVPWVDFYSLPSFSSAFHRS